MKPLSVGGIALFLVLALVNTNCLVNDKNTFYVVGNSLQTSDNCEVSNSIADLQTFGVLDLSMATKYLWYPVLQSEFPDSLGPTGNPETTLAPNDVTVKSYRVEFESDATSIPYRRTLSFNSHFALSAGDSIGIEMILVPQPIIDELRQDPVFNNTNVSPQILRQTQIELVVRVKFYGQTRAGWNVETDSFVYTILVCRGCLSSAVDLNTDDGETCFTTVDNAEKKGGCSPGQDRDIDCRLCTKLARSAQDQQFCVP